jgi:hypothetical protein
MMTHRLSQLLGKFQIEFDNNNITRRRRSSSLCLTFHPLLQSVRNT